MLIKIIAGQGRFGKVYTAVNNATGELMAMKEISFQPNDHKAIRKIAEELHIFEGIQHKHLIRYYGVEIHRVCNSNLSVYFVKLLFGLKIKILLFVFIKISGRVVNIYGVL